MSWLQTEPAVTKPTQADFERLKEQVRKSEFLKEQEREEMQPVVPGAPGILCGFNDGGLFKRFNCWGELEIKFDYDELTPEERVTIAQIRARIDVREYARLEKKLEEWDELDRQEQERERIRISQCRIPFLHLGCPPKEPS
jgi:hypothetical protein